MSEGRIRRVAGQIVEVEGLPALALNTVVQVGEAGLIGEVIRLEDEHATVQVYEATGGLHVGEPVSSTGSPLAVQLGPGLIGSAYDGLQRPLRRIHEQHGLFIQPGVSLPALDPDAQWAFTPAVSVGDEVSGGGVLGTVPETDIITHRVMVPHGLSGEVTHIAEEGDYTVNEVIAVLGDEHEITMRREWPVRRARPLHDRRQLDKPLVTGQRVLDAFFPVPQGGAAIVPGGFGTGKTVLEQSLAQWSAADVVVYIGCGERGNEMAEVLEEFPELEDRHSGHPIIERTVLIANTSNMPVSAREASIYTGTTIAEYFRDMGYDVLLLADSTSRWGEALRELSGRLGEIPAEGGFPAYLGTRLAEFYERAGRTALPGGREGSLTIAGAVSPPAGDFSEPVTQHSMRVAGTMWALDKDLARRRHYPAVGWTDSYTLYDLEGWFAEHTGEDWPELTTWAMATLQEADDLEDIVQLVGPDSLAPTDRLTLHTADLLKEDYLQQSAFSEVDRYCPPEKTYWMLRAIRAFKQVAQRALESDRMTFSQVRHSEATASLSTMKNIPDEDAPQQIEALIEQIEEGLSA